MTVVGIIIARLLVCLLFLVTSIYDLLTLPLYIILQKPWLRVSQMNLQRSVRTFISKKQQTIIYDSIRTMPDHYLLEVTTIDAALNEAHSRFHDKQCIAYREVLDTIPGFHEGKSVLKHQLSDYNWLTFGDVYQQIIAFREHLCAMDVSQGDMVMIYADTSHKWLVSALAIITNGSILVTLYTSLSDSAIVHGIEQVKVRHIVTTSLLFKKLRNLKSSLPTLKNVILLDGNGSESLDGKCDEQGLNITTFDSIVECSFENIPVNKVNIKPDDLAIIMYTSGTGGVPKGVRITHRNFIEGCRANLSQIAFFLPEIEQHTIIAYLPLAHILEIITECFLLFVGARLGFSSPSTITDISPGLQEGTPGDATLLRPTLMTAVPLVLERIRKGILQKLQKKGTFAVKALEFFINYKSFWLSRGFKTPLLDRLIFGQFTKVVGGRLAVLMVGGAPIPPKTQEFIRNVLNVILSQGYGSTETVGNGLFTDEYDMSLGKVGGPLCGLRVKLVSWVEGGYCVSDKPNPRGEIHFCSDSIAAGYYQLDDACESGFYVDDGGVYGRRWFRTGDIAEVLPNGSFKIIDRKKDFIKFAFGEYVSLGKIESKLKSSYFVNNICIVAQAQQNRVVALVIPNFKVIRKFARLLSIKLTNQTLKSTSASPSSLLSRDQNQELCQNKLISDLVLKKLRQFGRECGLRNCELPTDIILLDDDWTPENGLVTASFKIKRKALQHYYARQLEQLLN